MGNIWHFTKIYTNQGYNLDSSPEWNLDETLSSPFEIEAETGLIGEKLLYRELNCNFIIYESEGITVEYGTYLDLMKLVPKKFHPEESGSNLLKDYIDTCGLFAGTWLQRIKELGWILDYERVGEELIPHLAALIGYELEKTDETTLQDLRFQLENAVGWYKIKGTYDSLRSVANVSGIYLNLYEMFTEDYKTFLKIHYLEKNKESKAPYDYKINEKVKLMIHGNGRAGSTEWVNDATGKHTVTVHGNVCINTDNVPALEFNGAGDYIEAPSSADFAFGTKAFTIDWYLRFFDRNEEYDICGQYQDADNYWYIYVMADGKVGLVMQSGGSRIVEYMSLALSITPGTRCHFRLSRAENGPIKLYFNGLDTGWSEIETAAGKSLPFYNAPLSIGSRYAGQGPWLKGCIDSFRIVRGEALSWGPEYTLPKKYFKSPHIVNSLVLNKVRGVYPGEYLFKEHLMVNYKSIVEKIRPVNVVFGYEITLFPKCDESGSVNTEPGSIKTRTMSLWEFVRLYLNMEGSDHWNLNSGNRLDWKKEAFISAISKWRLGTGNKYKSPDEPGFDLENIVLEGTIDKVEITGGDVAFEFTVDSSVVQAGLSELGLAFNDNTLQIASTFPDVDKINGVELRIRVTVVPLGKL